LEFYTEDSMLPRLIVKSNNNNVQGIKMKKRIKIVKTVILCLLLMLVAGQLMGAEKENYQINGSFEYASNPDIPDYWTGMGRWTRSCAGIPGDLLTEKIVKDFIKKFYLDDSVAFAGNKSMRIEAPFFVSSTSMDVEAKHDYVLSVYLKSSRENMQVDLSAVYTDRDKAFLTNKIVVSKEWKRYQIKLANYPYNKLSIMVKPIDAGKLWVDAVQIENGLKATSFKPSHFDAGFTKPQQAIHIGVDRKIKTPSVSIPKPVKTPPAIDGKLENIWNNAVTLKMKTMMGSPCETPTKIKLLYDSKNIYIAFDCKDPRKANGKGESIEIFMDLLGIGSPYYQFIFTADGKKYNYRSTEGKHEWDWKADWKVVTKKNSKGGWTAEVAIPFSVMPESKEVAVIDALKMNFCRNYSAGPEIHLSWAPVSGTFLEPENFGTVYFAGSKSAALEIKDKVLVSTDPTDNRFDFVFRVKNNFVKPETATLILNVESKSAALQTKTMSFNFKPGKTDAIILKGFKLPDDRCRISLIILNKDGKIIKQLREFIETPHPLNIFPEYSYYTNEKTARIKVEYAGNLNVKDLSLILFAKLAPLPRIINKKSYAFKAAKNNIYTFPVKALRKAHKYTLYARLVNKQGKDVMTANCDIIKRDPNHTEAKINYFNRGIYLNGKPYIPYGYQIWLLGDEQLRFYKKLGHDYICYTGHWGNANRNHQFLGMCDQLGLKVMDFHAVRPHADAPYKMLRELSNHKSLFAVTPVDESVDSTVPELLANGKRANPYLVCYKNDNVAGYRFWRQQLNGLPGEAVSIDRYPLIKLAKGLPQTTSLIYTFERALEMMDEDGKRERKPVFIWMEGAEAQSKEPTEEELTWFHYIAVVNHCMGFTYFGGIPISRYARATIKTLDKELKAIQPFLFSFEEEPKITFGNARSQNLIRVLPKKLGNKLLLICVSRATENITAELNLSAILKGARANASVMFEDRSVKIGKDNIMRDKFTSLGRHVYKINLKK